MFTLKLNINRPHRQALATVALSLFTIAPTVYVAVTAVRINRPGHTREIEAEVGRQLGLRVTLEGVHHPRPDEDVFRGVVLRARESGPAGGVALARATSVRLLRAGRSLNLHVEGLRLRGGSPKQAIGQVSTLLQHAAEANFEQVNLSAPDCDLDLDNGDKAPLRYRFRDVVGTLQADRTAPSLTVSYKVPEEGPTNRCELALTRRRRGEAVHTELAFRHAEGPPLPARVLDPFFATAEWLGPSARVDGTLTLRQAGASDWEAEFQGHLLDVNLAALVGHRFPDHRLTGMARLKIDQARWADRPGAQGFGWVEAEGELTTGPGIIGMTLVRALKSEMSFQIAPRLENNQNDVPFHNLGLGFSMSKDGELHLSGGLGNEFPPGAVMVDAHPFPPLASAPEGAANVRGLIRTLFPTPDADAHALVPDTAESRILRYLPAPAVAKAKGKDIMTN